MGTLLYHSWFKNRIKTNVWTESFGGDKVTPKCSQYVAVHVLNLADSSVKPCYLKGHIIMIVLASLIICE
jgi:hypothetical protein